MAVKSAAGADSAHGRRYSSAPRLQSTNLTRPHDDPQRPASIIAPSRVGASFIREQIGIVANPEEPRDLFQAILMDRVDKVDLRLDCLSPQVSRNFSLFRTHSA